VNKRDRALLPDHVRCGRDLLCDLAQAERREWWLSNGRGAYAAGTLAGTLTRRYHGLLIAPVRPPLGRDLVFARADATLLADDREIPLHANRWASGAVAPAGFVHAESFRLEGRMPVWRYAIGDIAIEQRIWMEPGADTTYVAWKLIAPATSLAGPLRMRVHLLVNARDHHASMSVGGFAPAVTADDTALHCALPNGVSLHLRAQRGHVEPHHYWVEAFDLPLERERGLPDRDNHLCIGHACLELLPGEWTGVVGSLHEDASPYLAEAMERFHAQDIAILKQARAIAPGMRDAPAWIRQLVLAADAFVFTRPLPGLPDGESVIAGYPWFGDWGRDTMIALPGLTLPAGRYESARRILQTFARFVDGGMLPNWFPGAGETPEYNTADAALWYVEAWRSYLEATDDPDDGLLRAGTPGVQVTWMDARVDGRVITPRIGKAVELNALWHNAARGMAWIAARLGEDTLPYERIADRAREGFARFVRPDGRGLFDVIDGPDGSDASVRPNQVLAASLWSSPLDDVARRSVLATCGHELLTSHGLRSLAPSHADYRGTYLGGPAERDAHYHQGPAWAWLAGHFALAEFRTLGDPLPALARLEAFAGHLLDAGLGTVSEIFDGDPPHHPRGAPSQAWSVACVLDAWWRIHRAAGTS